MQKSVVIGIAFVACLIGATVGRLEAQCGSNPPCVDSGDIVDGQVKTADLANGAVTAAKLAANAVTGAKVANNSLSEQDFSVAKRLVVAKSGGDFTSIGAALASITPTSTNPYVIDVMPGTYVENVVLKSFVHLRGAGLEVVTVQGTNSFRSVFYGADVEGVRISGFTITGDRWGVYLDGGADATGPGISGTVTANVIRGNETGLLIIGFEAAPLVTENVIIENSAYGVSTGSNATPIILRNRIKGNGVGDLDIGSGPTHVSFNVFDTIFDNGGGVGQFNVKEDGTAHPAL